MDRILFHSRGSEEWLIFSNFAPYSFLWKGVMVPTSEHAYQSEKAFNEKGRLWVLEANSPSEARRRGRSVVGKEDWDEIKIPVMKDIIDAKFPEDISAFSTQRLLGSGDREIVELSPWEKYEFGSFWGVDRDNRGYNHLGKILMKRREYLKALFFKTEWK